MQVQLTKPELTRFIDEQVKAGAFPSAAAAVEAAVELMMQGRNVFDLSDEDIEAMNEAEDQMDRGEFIDFDGFAAEMRKKYCGKD